MQQKLTSELFMKNVQIFIDESLIIKQPQSVAEETSQSKETKLPGETVEHKKSSSRKNEITHDRYLEIFQEIIEKTQSIDERTNNFMLICQSERKLINKEFFRRQVDPY